MPLPLNSNPNISAVPRPLASIPGGPNNIPMNTASGDGAMAGGGVPVDRLVAALSGVSSAQDPKPYIPILNSLVKSIKDPEIQKELNGVIQAAQFQNPNTPQSTNPQTGQPMANASQLANTLRAKLEALTDGNRALDQMTQVQQPQPQAQQPMTNQQPGAPRTAQVLKKKKKTRGNPFKVLMGKVGKLLDHGLTKKQIVRSLTKQKYWNTETIEKAIDIVKDYNKKKSREASENIKRIITSEMEEINDFVSTYENISTGDLMMRLEYLEDYLDDAELVRDYIKDHPGFVPKNARKESGVIKRILKERGLK